jgi:AcrR family transcriptional regulator
MPSRSMTRDAILDAARGLASRFGREGFTVLDVSREANVSHTTIYNHFESRQHMLEALASGWNQSVLEAAKAQALEAGDLDAIGWIEAFMLAIAQRKFDLRLNDKSLFEAYWAALDGNPALREPYLAGIKAFIAKSLRDGAAKGRITTDETDSVARAMLILTAKFRHAVFIEKQAFEELREELQFSFNHIFRPLLVA